MLKAKIVANTNENQLKFHLTSLYDCNGAKCTFVIVTTMNKY